MSVRLRPAAPAERDIIDMIQTAWYTSGHGITLDDPEAKRSDPIELSSMGIFYAIVSL